MSALLRTFRHLSAVAVSYFSSWQSILAVDPFRSVHSVEYVLPSVGLPKLALRRRFLAQSSRHPLCDCYTISNSVRNVQ